MPLTEWNTQPNMKAFSEMSPKTRELIHLAEETISPEELEEAAKG